jgi:phosphoglycolate phosphatase (TIGR01487 family)
LIKAAAFDIDGTLTLPDRSLDLAAVESIRQLTVPVVLATGNTLCFATALAVTIGNISAVIAENGGIVTDGKSKIISGNIDACRRAAREVEGSAALALKRINSGERVTEIAYSRDTLSISDIELFRKLVAQCCDDASVVDSGFALHIKDARVNKGVGLAKVAELLSIPLSEFAAFGDAENDVQMLQMAGTGIAVGNADPEAKAAATYVAKHLYGLGVVEGLRYLRLL